MAFQTQVPDRTFKEPLFRSLMGVMAFVADTCCDGAMHEFLLERGAVVAPQTEFSPVLSGIQQEPSGASVRLVAGKTVTVLNRRMHHLLLPERCVAFCAECGHLGLQFPALSAQ